MTLDEFVAVVAGRLIVSCQAHGGPLRDTATVARLAQAAVAGGAAAIRGGGVGGVADVRAIRAAVTVPVIGLTKSGDAEVYITPTLDEAIAVADAGADVVACDLTGRPRADGSDATALVEALHRRGALLLADVSTLDEALAAIDGGADAVATTLSGYTAASPHAVGPDLELVAAIRAAAPHSVVIAEGRYHRPELAVAALETGATTVVVGAAITDPAWITARFAGVLEERRRASGR